MKAIKNFLPFLAVLILTSGASAQWDPSFGNGGAVIRDWFGKDDVATDILVQDDGRIIVVGNAIVQSHREIIITRFYDNGIIDSTFGTNGYTTTAAGTVNSYAKAAAIQPDGKIVVAGYFDNNFYNDAAVARYNSDGSLDSTFGVNGIAHFILSNQFDELHDIVIQSNGRIIVAGRTFFNNTYDFLILRLLSDGSPDLTFGINGKVTTEYLASDEIIHAMLIQPDGKLLVAGNTKPGSSYFAAARYLTDGSPDPTFGTGGKMFVSSGNRFDNCYGVALQPDGKIVMAGTHHNNQIDEYMVVRLNADGTPDNTFGTAGIATLPTQIASDAANDVLIQADGKIMLAGAGVGNQATLIRLTANGQPDITFGNQGFYGGNFGGQYSLLNGLCFAGNNTLVACGAIRVGNNDDFLVTKTMFSLQTTLEETAPVSSFELNVYPNPASDYLTLDLKTVLEGKGTITIVDSRGRVVLHQPFGFLYPPVKIALPEGLAGGNYFLQVRSGNQAAISQFIIK